MTTLKEAMALLGGSVTKSRKNISNIAEELLGKYKDIAPKGKTSASFIKGLRSKL